MDNFKNFCLDDVNFGVVGGGLTAHPVGDKRGSSSTEFSKHFRILSGFFQSSSSGDPTLVHNNGTVACKSGIALLHKNKACAAVL